MTIARPYPETVEALEAKLREAEHEIEALRLRLGYKTQEVAIAEERIAEKADRIQGLQQTIEHQARQDGESDRSRDLEFRVDALLLDRATLLERIAALEAENERLKHTRSWMDGMIREFLAVQPRTHRPARTRAETANEGD